MFTVLSSLSFDNTLLSSGIDITETYLRNFANSANVEDNLTSLLGTANPDTLVAILQQWRDGNFQIIPPIEILSTSQLNGAHGAFSAQTNRIYLSDAFISSASVEGIVNVLLEEIGHKLDSVVNTVDTAGDEGELFSALVRGISLSATELNRIQAEDDRAVIIIDGESVAVEQAATLVGVWDFLSYANAVTVVGNYAYAVGDGLEILDISNPAHPSFKGYDETSSDFALGVQVVGNYAYVADGSSGLQIINISNPSLPTLQGNYDTSGYARGVQVIGNYAYVADENSGLQIIDISNPTTPTLKGNYDTSGDDFFSAEGVQIVGNYAYVADWYSRLQIIDISNPTTPTLTGNYRTSGSAYDVQVVGNYAYVANGGLGLQIIDISNPTTPTLTGNYDTSGWAQGVQVVGNYAYVADGSSGLQIIDISNPTTPTLTGNYDTSGYAQGVQVVGNYAYVANGQDGPGLQIIDISNPTTPTLTDNYNTSSWAQGVQVVGNYAYVSDHDSGLQIINISNPALPTLKGNYDTSGDANGVQVVGNYAYVADDDSGLQIINISNPALPTLQGNYDTSGYANGVQVVGNYAYVADDDSGLQIIDISNPSLPTLKGNYDTSGYANGVQVVGNYAYVADDDSGLQIIDISNPALPTLKGNYDTSGDANGVQVVGNYAYVADDDGGLKIIDVSEFTTPGTDINSAPSDLMFTPNQTTYNAGETLNLTGAWVKDLNGSSDLARVDMWVQKPNGQWIDLTDATAFTPWTGGNEWGGFNYSLALGNYEAGNYTLWGQASDKAGATSNAVTKTFTVLNNSANFAPTDLQFNLNKTIYTVGDILNLTGAWVKDLNGSNDLSRVDMWIKPDGGNWIDLGDATTFTPWSGGAEWGGFNYSLNLSGYRPDNYTLWGRAWDQSGAVSNAVTKTFSLVGSVNSAPTDLQFNLNKTIYTVGDTLTLTGAWVKDLNGSDDLTRVDMWIKPDRGNWINLSDATTFTPWSGGAEWGSFDYSLSLGSYTPGNYTLWGQASDRSGAVSNEVSRVFEMIAGTGITG
jgi:hypothetical protein